MSDLMDDLIGLEYAVESNPPHTYNCWEIAVLVRERLGLDTPTPWSVDVTQPEAEISKQLAIASELGWLEVIGPINGDLIFMGQFEDQLFHVGTYYRNGVIHAVPDVGSCYWQVRQIERIFPISKCLRLCG